MAIQLENKYIKEVDRIIQEAKNDLNHNDRLLATLIGDHGYIGATEKLLSTKRIQ